MRNVLIMGAAGRDFHNFNTYFRGQDDICVKAFTATQIPNIEGKNILPNLLVNSILMGYRSVQNPICSN